MKKPLKVFTDENKPLIYANTSIMVRKQGSIALAVVTGERFAS
jgi:hypothetical protein